MSANLVVRPTLSTDRRVISASRRTDIPAFYAEWFMNRIRRGVVAVPNPYSDQVSWQSLKPESVDAIVFWTKDAGPLLPHLDELDRLGYRYYFQYTITGYPAWLEPRTPHGLEAIRRFLDTSTRLAPERVIWRYDPILFMPGLSEDWHVENFALIAEALHGATRRCVISFLDLYRKTAVNLGSACRAHNLGAFDKVWRPFPRDMSDFGETLGSIAQSHDFELVTCAEPVSVVGGLGPCISAGKCIDTELLARAGVLSASTRKDDGQRAACGCVRSRDIGMYDSCQHGCAYCYATVSTEVAVANIRNRHDPHSASLLDWVSDEDCPAWPSAGGQISLPSRLARRG